MTQIRRGPWTIPVAAMCTIICAASSAHAEYLIGAGDALSFAIAGVPELAEKAPVDVDGNVTLPLAGSIAVAGLSVPQALAKVQAILPGKEYRRHTDDGREFPVIIAPGAITLSIALYRPVYLNGDVAKPGQEPFTPGLTVRNAVALAGGFDILRFKMDNPFLQLSDLTSSYNQLWIQYAKDQARIARVQAELDGKGQLDGQAVITTPIASSLAHEIIDNEREQLAVDNADFAKEQVYLRAAVLKETDRSKVLLEQQSKEQDGVRADSADLQRYTELFNKGATALPALSEARREVLLSSTRALQTTALLDSVEREQQDLQRRLDRSGDARRASLLRDMQEANTALAATRAALQAASDKLRYTGMVKSQLLRDGGSRAVITIMRAAIGRTDRISADLDAALEPGDSVDVALQAELPLTAAH